MDTELDHAGLPPGYPVAYRREAVLRDGRRVLIRPILPSDAPELAEAIKTADPETLRRRFLGGPPRLTPALLEHLTVVDYVHRFALVAIDTVTGRGVAIARYEPISDGVADIAVAVRPAWRRVGLATLLIATLAKAAAERGIHTFTASYLAQNRPIAALLEDVHGLRKQVIEKGIAELSIDLPPPPDEGQPAKSHSGPRARPATAGASSVGAVGTDPGAQAEDDQTGGGEGGRPDKAGLWLLSFTRCEQAGCVDGKDLRGPARHALPVGG